MINIIEIPPPNEKYQRYLSSAVWKKLRQAVIDRCNDCCERCGKRLVDEIHHVTYKRIYKEDLDDLLGLCEGCHAYIHEKTKIDPIVDSVGIKVTLKMIEYFDKSTLRFRRFRHARHDMMPDPYVGHYIVPKDIFFDEKGRPNTDPENWTDYRSRGSMRYAKRHFSLTESEKKEIEERCEYERRRYQQHPDHYKWYKSINLKTIRKILKQSQILVSGGQEYEIKGIRKTKTKGISISYYGYFGRTFRSDRYNNVVDLLLDGKLLFDEERKLWVATFQFYDLVKSNR